MQTPIEAVFWDSDNTLVDTAAHHWNKHLHTLKPLGITLAEEDRARIYTNNGSQNWAWLAAERGLSMAEHAYLDAIDRWYFDHIGEIAIRAGVLDAIALFDSAGLIQGVVSNGRTKSVHAALDARALSPRFRFILCAEDYKGRKPGPEPYLAALTRAQQIMGRIIDPARCLVIEDDPKGVESGLAAGMQVIHRPPGEDDTDVFLERIRALLPPRHYRNNGPAR